jgi:hypothetical protein
MASTLPQCFADIGFTQLIGMTMALTSGFVLRFILRYLYKQGHVVGVQHGLTGETLRCHNICSHTALAMCAQPDRARHVLECCSKWNDGALPPPVTSTATTVDSTVPAGVSSLGTCARVPV